MVSSFRELAMVRVSINCHFLSMGQGCAVQLALFHLSRWFMSKVVGQTVICMFSLLTPVFSKVIVDDLLGCPLRPLHSHPRALHVMTGNDSPRKHNDYPGSLFHLLAGWFDLMHISIFPLDESNGFWIQDSCAALNKSPIHSVSLSMTSSAMVGLSIRMERSF